MAYMGVLELQFMKRRTALLKGRIVPKAAVFQYVCRPVEGMGDLFRIVSIGAGGDDLAAQFAVAF